MDTTSIYIENMQKNLRTLRYLLGWTAEQLGDRVGLTKQTISNLEKPGSTMTKLQYIAIRSVIESEISLREDAEEREYLGTAIAVLVDDTDKIDPEEKEELKKNMIIYGAAKTGGADIELLRAQRRSALQGHLDKMIKAQKVMEETLPFDDLLEMYRFWGATGVFVKNWIQLLLKEEDYKDRTERAPKKRGRKPKNDT